MQLSGAAGLLLGFSSSKGHGLLKPMPLLFYFINFSVTMQNFITLL